MDKSAPPKKPYNSIVRVGMWMTVAAALVWAGGATYEKIKTYVPYALGLGIAVLIFGLAYEFRKKATAREAPTAK